MHSNRVRRTTGSDSGFYAKKRGLGEGTGKLGGAYKKVSISVRTLERVSEGKSLGGTMVEWWPTASLLESGGSHHNDNQKKKNRRLGHSPTAKGKQQDQE